MAGTSPDFDATLFRTQITGAMVMEAPLNPALGPFFVWDPAATFVKADDAGNPWKWDQAPVTRDAPQPLYVPVAFDSKATGSPQGVDTPVGAFNAAELEAVVLDDAWARLLEWGGRRPDGVVLSDTRYDLISAVPTGLFDVTVWTLRLVAADRR